MMQTIKTTHMACFRHATNNIQYDLYGVVRTCKNQHKCRYGHSTNIYHNNCNSMKTNETYEIFSIQARWDRVSLRRAQAIHQLRGPLAPQVSPAPSCLSVHRKFWNNLSVATWKHGKYIGVPIGWDVAWYTAVQVPTYTAWRLKYH